MQNYMMSKQLLCLLLNSSRRALHMLAAAEARLSCVENNHASQLTGILRQLFPPARQYSTAGPTGHFLTSLQLHQSSLPLCQAGCHYSSAAGPDSSATATSGEDTHPAARSLRDMAIAFTCGRCDTRAVKAFSRQAYEQGVVLITCPGCKAMHLIADHLGWFGDRGFQIDEYMQSQGHTLKRVSQEQSQAVTEQLTAEDLVGWSKSSSTCLAAFEPKSSHGWLELMCFVPALLSIGSSPQLAAPAIGVLTQVQQLLSSVAAAASPAEGSEGPKGGCGSGNATDSCSTGSSPTPGKQLGNSSPPTAPAVSAQPEDGVLQLEPGDVAAWVRVQEEQQQKQEQQQQQ